MDEFGIGSAARASLQLYEMASRGSGRSERMLALARSGDQIVTTTAKEADRLRRRLKEMGKGGITVVACRDVSGVHNVARRAEGRTHFDHSWVHAHFVDRVREAEDDLRRLADSFSGRPIERRHEDRPNVMNLQRDQF